MEADKHVFAIEKIMLKNRNMPISRCYKNITMCESIFLNVKDRSCKRYLPKLTTYCPKYNLILSLSKKLLNGARLYQGCIIDPCLYWRSSFPWTKTIHHIDLPVNEACVAKTWANDSQALRVNPDQPALSNYGGFKVPIDMQQKRKCHQCRNNLEGLACADFVGWSLTPLYRWTFIEEFKEFKENALTDAPLTLRHFHCRRSRASHWTGLHTLVILSHNIKSTRGCMSCFLCFVFTFQ